MALTPLPDLTDEQSRYLAHLDDVIAYLEEGLHLWGDMSFVRGQMAGLNVARDSYIDLVTGRY